MFFRIQVVFSNVSVTVFQVGYNFLLAAFTIQVSALRAFVGACPLPLTCHILCCRLLRQWSILVHGFFKGAWDEFKPNCSPIGEELANSGSDAARYCIPIQIDSLIVVRKCLECFRLYVA